MDDNNSGYRNSGDRNSGDRNSGNWNSGSGNSGYRNSGHLNSGDLNSGHFNSGHFNSGDWNSSNRHTGCFNSENAKKAYYFNVLSSVDEWEAAEKPDWLYEPATTKWVADSEMTDQEKVDNPTFHTTGGYLRINDIGEEWRKAFEGASDEDIQAVRDLPNFDADVFKEITGLDLSENKTENSAGKIVEIDGVKYKLQEIE